MSSNRTANAKPAYHGNTPPYVYIYCAVTQSHARGATDELCARGAARPARARGGKGAVCVSSTDQLENKMLRAVSARYAAPIRRGRQCLCSVREAAEWLPGSGSWRADHPPPRQLTKLLYGAPDVEELMNVVNVHGDAFNAVHCSALWSRLGGLAKTDPEQRRWLRQNEAALSVAREHTLRLLPTFGPRQLANSASR